MEMCGICFSPFDYVNYKIIAFEVRSKDFFKTLPIRVIPFLLLLEGEFFNSGCKEVFEVIGVRKVVYNLQFILV